MNNDQVGQLYQYTENPYSLPNITRQFSELFRANTRVCLETGGFVLPEGYELAYSESQADDRTLLSKPDFLRELFLSGLRNMLDFLIHFQMYHELHSLQRNIAGKWMPLNPSAMLNHFCRHPLQFNSSASEYNSLSVRGGLGLLDEPEFIQTAKQRVYFLLDDYLKGGAMYKDTFQFGQRQCPIFRRVMLDIANIYLPIISNKLIQPYVQNGVGCLLEGVEYDPRDLALLDGSDMLLRSLILAYGPSARTSD